MLDLRVATYLAIALFFIRKAMRKARKPVKEPTNKHPIVDTIKKCKNYDIPPLSKSTQDAVEQLFANSMADEVVDEVDRTILRQLMNKAAHDFSLRKLTNGNFNKRP